MNKEQQELIDEAYKNYKRITHKINEKNHYGEYSKWGDAPLISGVQHLTKDSFIQMIKINSEFPEKWGLTIEERELSLEERVRIYGVDKIQINDAGYYEHSYTQFKVDEAKIPTKLITITYNDKTITSYE